MKNNMPKAYIFSGLPGVGKTTLAKLLAKKLHIAYFRIDTIEYYLKKEYSKELTKQGYKLTYYLAKENLKLGNNVIIDCCNPIKESRELWNKLAEVKNTIVINIEVICSNKETHKNRIEQRYLTNKNKYPSWQDVINREYHAWDDKNLLKIDTANRDINESFINLLKILL